MEFVIEIHNIETGSVREITVVAPDYTRALIKGEIALGPDEYIKKIDDNV